MVSILSLCIKFVMVLVNLILMIDILVEVFNWGFIVVNEVEYYCLI